MAKDYPITKKDMVLAGSVVVGVISFVYGRVLASENTRLYINTGKILIYVGLGLLVVDRLIKRFKK